jgi:endonuclease/exonuclease/phosphatase family metal-dependent hydrolase
MRIPLLLILLLRSLCPAQQTVRVITWNLQWFPGKAPAPLPERIPEHIAEVQAALRTMHPDILVLQEVAGENVVKEAISVLPGFHVAVVSRFKNAAGFIDPQQIAICSRFPARYVHSSPWARGWAGAPRGFAFASLDCDGASLNIYGLHLKSNLGDPQINTAKREDAVEQLLRHMNDTKAEEAARDSRWIICGDFNTDSVNAAVPSERTFPLLTAAGFTWTFEGVPHARRVTCPATDRYPPASFDHFFVKGLGTPGARPLSEIMGSDHFPVCLDIALTKVNREPAAPVPASAGQTKP